MKPVIQNLFNATSRQRVEKQAVLLEDRCQAEMELRVKDRATTDTLEKLRAANEALARDNKHLAQVALSSFTAPGHERVPARAGCVCAGLRRGWCREGVGWQAWS